MTTYTATYSPDDDKLRLYASSRLDSETYGRVKAAGFRWAPKQDLFFAVWRPAAEDMAIELAGEIDDEDKSLVERAEERADRFEDYSGKRTAEAERARKAVAAIADGIPMGQPILVGHHSERRARKDAERIANGMRKSIKLWETAGYWKSRATGALRHAKYKELPSVRARRIKTLEAELRKVQRTAKGANTFLMLWRNVDDASKFKRNGEPVDDIRERAMFIANRCYLSQCFPLSEFPRDPPASQYEGQMGVWSALEGNVITAEQARDIAIPRYETSLAHCARWIAHYENRLTYERAMLEDAGGTVADKTGPEKGGAVRCWASPHFGRGWAYIRKVNKTSVSVLDNYGNGGRDFSRTIPFDQLEGVMTKAEVDTARADGRLREIGPGKAGDPPVGFFLLEAPEPEPEPEPDKQVEAAPFEQMRESLRNGVKVVSVPQLFPTPPELAERVIEAAEIRPLDRVLEPSAGTGSLIDEIPFGTTLVAVEINADLAERVRRNRPNALVFAADFLTACGNDETSSQIVLGEFDRIVMNPPFADQQDIRHVEHALRFLKPGGRLVAIMSAGVTFRQDRAAVTFRELVEGCGGTIEELPEDAFEAAGTGVRAVLVTIDG
jgi:predicted RNA methylase